MSDSRFAYVDRRSREVRQDPIYAAGLLDWCHNSPLGILLTRLLLSRRLVSRLYGWYGRQPWTRGRIAPFARDLGVDLTEVPDPLSSFRCLADFVTRRIDLSRRPIDPDPDVCVCPADGRVLAYPRVRLGDRFRIKSGLFDLEGLLRDPGLATGCDGGSLVTVRLYLGDYHHFHFPASGTPGAPRPLAGRYYAVSPYARRWLVPFYRDNHRVVTRLASDRFGPIAMVEIGAFTVGSVRQAFVPDRPVAKGDHKGWFALGGSLLVLLFEPGGVRLDRDLIEGTEAGLETYVRLGESIGRSLAAVSRDPGGAPGSGWRPRY